MVELIYESTSRPVITELLLQGSDSANFNTPASFSRIVSLADMDVVFDIGEIRFTLSENNTPVGTRVQLDNVSVHQVSDFDAWNLTIGGANGAPGPTGATGDPGPAGATGPTGPPGCRWR